MSAKTKQLPMGSVLLLFLLLRRLCHRHPSRNAGCCGSLFYGSDSVSLRHDDSDTAAHCHRNLAHSGKAVSLDCTAYLSHARGLFCFVSAEPVCRISGGRFYPANTLREPNSLQTKRCRTLLCLLRRRSGFSAGDSRRISAACSLLLADFLRQSARQLTPRCDTLFPASGTDAEHCNPPDSQNHTGATHRQHQQRRKTSIETLRDHPLFFRTLRDSGGERCISQHRHALRTAPALFPCLDSEKSTGNQLCVAALPAVLLVSPNAGSTPLLWRMLCVHADSCSWRRPHLPIPIFSDTAFGSSALRHILPHWHVLDSLEKCRGISDGIGSGSSRLPQGHIFPRLHAADYDRAAAAGNRPAQAALKNEKNRRLIFSEFS